MTNQAQNPSQENPVNQLSEENRRELNRVRAMLSVMSRATGIKGAEFPPEDTATVMEDLEHRLYLLLKQIQPV